MAEKPVKLTPTLDCTSCGACCVEAGSVTVYPEDGVPRRHTRSVRGRMGYLSDDYLDGIREMRTEDPGTRCVCLRGTVGVEVRCAIYARRSRVCRGFDAGSEGCLAARAVMERKRARPEYGPRGYEVRPPPAAPTPPPRQPEGREGMARITAAERKRQEAEARDRAIHAALAWPQEPCPQPFTKAEMDRLAGEMLSAPVPAWTFNAYSKRVSLGCFNSVHHSTCSATRTTTQTQGGPWFATEAEARLAMRWGVCRGMAETLHRLVEAEAKAVVRGVATA